MAQTPQACGFTSSPMTAQILIGRRQRTFIAPDSALPINDGRTVANGTDGRTRTDTPFKAKDFESPETTNSTTSALLLKFGRDRGT